MVLLLLSLTTLFSVAASLRYPPLTTALEPDDVLSLLPLTTKAYPDAVLSSPPPMTEYSPEARLGYPSLICVYVLIRIILFRFVYELRLWRKE